MANWITLTDNNDNYRHLDSRVGKQAASDFEKKKKNEKIRSSKLCRNSQNLKRKDTFSPAFVWLFVIFSRIWMK